MARLTAVAGILLMMAVCLSLFDREVILLGLTASFTLLVVAVGGWLASRFLRDLPRVRLQRAHFALWEILATMCLGGLLFTIVRVADIDGMPAFDPEFTIFAVTSGLLGLACGMVATASSTRRRIAWGMGCVLMWGILPWINLGLFYFFPLAFSLEISAYLLLFYPALGVQAVMIWGTLFPLKYAFPGFLCEREPAPAEESSSEAKVETDDFAQIR